MKNPKESYHDKGHATDTRGMLMHPTRPDDVPEGKFGRFIPTSFPPYEPTDQALHELAETMKETEKDESRHIPLAFAFLGQFIDHDLTLEPVSRLDQRLDPEALTNFRTPALDLDSVYGSNPDVARHLYDTYGNNQTPVTEAGPDTSHHTLPYKLLTEDKDQSIDLPRNRQGTAIIGDPRNDENIFISQLHRRFIGFHNEVADYLAYHKPDLKNNHKALYETARKEVTLHYHWIILHEFLPLIIGKQLTREILKERLFYRPEHRPFIPIEFAGAAYRFGHTLIRDTYHLNDRKRNRSLFEVPFFGLVPKDFFAVGIPRSFNLDWSFFIEYPLHYSGNAHLQYCRAIDSKVTMPLFELPFIHPDQDPPVSLPERNMRRAKTLGLPSGQEMARQIRSKDSKARVYTNEDFNIRIDGLEDQLPLWFYILREGEEESRGKHLGRTGGRIVGETLVGIIELTQQTLFNCDELAKWEPSFGKNEGKFYLRDLIEYRFDPS